MRQMNFMDLDFTNHAVSPFIELGAYEALWERDGASFKKLAAAFAKDKNALPSSFVDFETSLENANFVHNRFKECGVHDYGVHVNGAGEYPNRLRDAADPIELLYYRGWWNQLDAPRSIAVIGTRNPSNDGIRRTRQLVRALLDDDFTIVSGLASGIDATAHRTTIDEGGRTIAVLGTPLNHTYPRENADLQNEIASNHLLISQVPVKYYERAHNPVKNRHFFPARNVTMSALTDATVIVEAGEISGTLIQGRAALKQGRKLFILESCFNNSELTWPEKFEKLGAIRVREYNDIKHHLVPESAH